MRTGMGGAAIRDLQILLDSGAVGGLSDEQLIERFLATKDSAAFEALVMRHGPMVWGVCRRMLGDHHDAQDAFQATFLVLARKAASVSPRGLVGNWLYGVACRTALKAKGMRARRRSRERTVAEMPEPESPRPIDDRLPLIDLELARLPQKYRAAIVLCDLEGMTQEEAARRVGCPVGTLSGRLWRGRAMLAKRLQRRGVTLAGGTLVALLAQEAATAGPPGSLISTSVAGAVSYAARRAAAPTLVSVEAVRLAEGVLMSMMVARWKVAALVVAALGILGSWTALMAHPRRDDDPKANAAKPAAKAVSQSDRQGDKAGPILRGTIVDEAGKPLAGARVTLYSGIATRWKGQEATTGEDGTYRFDPLKTGSMTKKDKADRWDLYVGVQIFHPTHASEDGHSWWDLTVPGINGHEEVRDFKMIPGGAVSGRIVDADTGKPMPGLDLRVMSPGPRNVKFNRYATTDKDGRFDVPALFPGEYTIDVNSPRLSYPVLGQVRIEAKKTAELSYTMKASHETWVARIFHEYGGRQKLEGLRAFTQTVREPGAGGRMTVTKHFVQLPDRYRYESHDPASNRTLICILTDNGMKRWFKEPDGKVEPVHFGGLEMPVSYWHESLKFFGPRTPLRANEWDYERTWLGESKIGDRAVVGIHTQKTKRGVTADLDMFFDQETALLVSDTARPDLVVTEYKDYRDIGGVRMATKAIRKTQKGETVESEVIDFKAVEKLDPSVFEKP